MADDSYVPPPSNHKPSKVGKVFLRVLLILALMGGGSVGLIIIGSAMEDGNPATTDAGTPWIATGVIGLILTVIAVMTAMALGFEDDE